MTLSTILTRCAATLLAIVSLSACAPPEPRGPLVLAASSMQEALGEAAALWKGQGHPAPVLSFAGTPALARQVEQGAPADIVISADAEWMDWLAERDLVDPGTRRDIASNALVLVAADTQDTGGTIGDRLQALGDGRLAIADPASVPAGRYARAALESMGLWVLVEDRIVPAENVRAALALVESGEARFGIVYASDALASQRVHRVASFDRADTPPIVYPAARAARSQHAEAQAFLDFLAGPQAQAIFAEHGFSAVGQAQ